MAATEFACRALARALLPLALLSVGCNAKGPAQRPSVGSGGAAPASEDSGQDGKGPAGAPGIDPRLLRSAKLFEDIHLNDPTQKIETAAVISLRAYAAAQAAFRKVERYPGKGLVYANPRDGRGFVDLHRLGGPDGKGAVLGLIDKAFAEATGPASAKQGYYFVDITADARTGGYDYSKQFGLCAAPARYNPGRGPPKPATFVIDASGQVWLAATGGRPVTVFPDVTDGNWLQFARSRGLPAVAFDRTQTAE